MGNGTNDFVNRAYATAIGMGMSGDTMITVGNQSVSVSSFLTNFDSVHEQAEAKMIAQYYNYIGNDAANDSFHDMPKDLLDAAAQVHDEQRVAAGGDLQSEIAANENFAMSAIDAFFSSGNTASGNPFDLAAAVFIGVGETGWDLLSQELR